MDSLSLILHAHRIDIYIKKLFLKEILKINVNSLPFYAQQDSGQYHEHLKKLNLK